MPADQHHDAPVVDEPPTRARSAVDSSQEDLPTQAGLPIFGPDGDDVSWLERRSSPPPPPPPFEKPPERPLFAPEPTDGAPTRHPRPGSAAAAAAAPAPTPSGSATTRPRGDYWPWESNTGTGVGVGLGSGLVDGRGLTSSTVLPVVEDGRVPGRSWFRLGAVLSVVVLLVVAVIIVITLGRGPSTPQAPEADDLIEPVASSPLDAVSATAFDPLGTDGEENDDEAANAVDGDVATSWGTQSYNDQFGPPPGLKTGVGLALDLDGEQAVTKVKVTFIGAPTQVALYLTDSPPTSVADLTPAATSRARRTSAVLKLPEPTTASHAVIWLTSLPAEGSIFRGRVAEIVVQAATRP